MKRLGRRPRVQVDGREEDDAAAGAKREGRSNAVRDADVRWKTGNDVSSERRLNMIINTRYARCSRDDFICVPSRVFSCEVVSTANRAFYHQCLKLLGLLLAGSRKHLSLDAVAYL